MGLGRDELRDPTLVQRILPPHVVVERVVGSGGQGVVFAGSVDGEPSAVKVYFPGQVRARIDREVSLLQKLKSRFIARVLWTGDIDTGADPLRVVASEFLEGGSLDSHLHDGPIALDRVEVLLHSMCAAIKLFWEHRVVHRDLKPANLLERGDGRWCVIDLGLARHLDESSLTVQGGTWGTVGYLSPEQARCVRTLTCKSDIFTAGVVALESLLGSHPTSGDQNRVCASDFAYSLPGNVDTWRFASLLRRMIDLRAFRRPLPNEVMSALEQLNPELAL